MGSARKADAEMAKGVRNWGVAMRFERAGLVAGASNILTESQANTAHASRVAFAMEVGPWAKIYLLGPRAKVIAEMIPLRA
mgnify:CR=1 FL=1